MQAKIFRFKLVTFTFKLYCGFSLIELMVVVSITAILALIAIPNYKSYVARTNATQMLAMTDSCQTQIYKYFIDKGNLPDGASAGQTITCQTVLLTPGTMVRIPDSSSQIQATYGINAGTARFTLTHDAIKENNTLCNLYVNLAPSNGELIFSCNTDCTTRSFFPTTCAIKT